MQKKKKKKTLFSGRKDNCFIPKMKVYLEIVQVCKYISHFLSSSYQTERLGIYPLLATSLTLILLDPKFIKLWINK